MSIKYYIYKLVCDDVQDFLYINFTKNYSQKKRYYKDNSYLTYKIHKNELLYKTIRENGGWENWRFIIIDQVECTKYQINSICEKYRQHEKANLEKTKTRNINIDSTLNKLKSDILLIEDHKIQEKTIKYNKENNIIDKNNLVKQLQNQNNIIQDSNYIPKQDKIYENYKQCEKTNLEENKTNQTTNICDTKDDFIVNKDKSLPPTRESHKISKTTTKCNENDIIICKKDLDIQLKPQNNTKEILIDNDNIIQNTNNITNQQQLYENNTKDYVVNNEDKIQKMQQKDNILTSALSKYHKELSKELLQLKMINIKNKKDNKSLKTSKKDIKSNTLKNRDYLNIKKS